MSNEVSLPPPKQALRERLEKLGLPSALLPGVMNCYQSCDSRLVVIENSSFMKTKDSRVGRIGRGGSIKRVDNVSRWEEVKECVAFHCKMASTAWMPTKYWLLNKPTGVISDCSKKFALCWSTPEEVPKEMGHIRHMMKNVTLDESKCELTSRLGHISKLISNESTKRSESDNPITVIIYTQGMPTNRNGQSGNTIRQEFRSELWSLSKLPVKVIIRLCTNDEKVINMYNDMDDKFASIDVMDDYWGEAMEVYLHNPWLTYSIGLHRLRETGLAPALLSDLDRRQLTLDEIHQLCLLMFVGEDTSVYLPLPPHEPTAPTHLRRLSWIDSWIPFIMKIDHLLRKEELQWNPIRKMMMPWIDLKKLESTLKERCVESSDDHHVNFGPGRFYIGHFGKTPQQRQNQKSQQNTRRESSPPNKPKPKRWSSVRVAFDNKGGNDLTLEEVIQQWSHKPPDYKRYHSLQHLLITVPQTFPPKNKKVEHHSYFSKWKKFDKQAFADLSHDRMKPLLRRALRKAKFFLHPDKLPKDLTENQTILFRTLWDVIMQRELDM